MLIHKSTLLLGLMLAPVYAAIALAQSAYAQAIPAVCSSCGRAHSGACSGSGASSSSSPAASVGVHAVSVNEATDGSFTPLTEGHYHGDGHNHGPPVLAANGTPPVDFQVATRWTSTATDGFLGFGPMQGDPITLTWGIPRDGTPLSFATGIPGVGTISGPSNLVSFLDDVAGTPADAGVTDLQDKSWFPILESVYERWDALSGLNFNYEENDDGATVSTGGPAGVLGTRADLRISGQSVDGQSGPNILALNAFPNSGDGVIDTDNTSFFGNSANNFLGLRNVLAHEVGHGLGLAHVLSNNAAFLLEPTISLGFDGPQLNDILAVQHSYGDALESNGGNDTAATATSIGVFGAGDAWAIGTGADSSAGGTIVAATETDFVSIDGEGDQDFFSFSVDEDVVLDAVLTQVGAVFNQADELPMGLPQTALDTRSLAALQLEIVEISSLGVVTQLGVSGESIGFEEAITGLVLQAGVEYAALVRNELGSLDDNTQLFRLDLSFAEIAAVPEPSTLVLLLLAGAGATPRRRAATAA